MRDHERGIWLWVLTEDDGSAGFVYQFNQIWLTRTLMFHNFTTGKDHGVLGY